MSEQRDSEYLADVLDQLVKGLQVENPRVWAREIGIAAQRVGRLKERRK